jgi:general L-amino acid transport system substrate-binding protein
LRNSLIPAILRTSRLESYSCTTHRPPRTTKYNTSPQDHRGRGGGGYPPLLAAVLLLFALPARAATLDHIRQIKTLRCGINQETPEYSTSDDHGPRQAFDADICKAVAVAILGPNARTTIVSYPDDVAAMAALRAGKVDLLPTLTLDFKHSANTGIAFSPPLLYDGVGFLVSLSAGLTHAADLSGSKVCFLAETEVEAALRAWFAKQHLTFVPFPFQEEGEMEAAFTTGNCTALAGDLTRLAATRVGFGPLASRYTLLPEQISKDPLAAASRSDDPALANIVRWTIEVLLQAEESGLMLHTIAAAPTNSDPTVAFLTGKTREIGARLGLDNAWATRVIAAVGNYGEIYDRDLGAQSPLKLPRALNRLYTQSGLMYPLPLK